MNIKKILTILVILIAVVGFTISSTSAATKTLKIIDGKKIIEKIGNEDILGVSYSTKKNTQLTQTSRNVLININNEENNPNSNYLIKAKVIFRNEKNGKIIKRIYYNNDYKNSISISRVVPKTWTPLKATINYKKEINEDKKKITKKNKMKKLLKK